MNFRVKILTLPILLILLTVAPLFSALAMDTINLGPLFYMEKDEETGEKKLDALGPFISYKKEGHETGYGFRPIFYKYDNAEKDRTSFDFLYPLSTYRTFEGDTKFQALVYIFYYKSTLKESVIESGSIRSFHFFCFRSFYKQKIMEPLIPIYYGPL